MSEWATKVALYYRGKSISSRDVEEATYAVQVSDPGIVANEPLIRSELWYYRQGIRWGRRYPSPTDWI
jgi:hypothetical protein